MTAITYIMAINFSSTLHVNFVISFTTFTLQFGEIFPKSILKKIQLSYRNVHLTGNVISCSMFVIFCKSDFKGRKTQRI